MEPVKWYNSTTLRTAVGLFFSVLFLAVPRVKAAFEASGVSADSILASLATAVGLLSPIIVAVKRVLQPNRPPISGSKADPTRP